MLQYLEFNEPIPSCEINSLVWKGDGWKFVYAIDTDEEITDKNPSNDGGSRFIVYGHISNLTVRKSGNESINSINISFNTLSEYKALLNSLSEEDKKYREKFLAENKDQMEELTKKKENYIRILKNKNYSYKELRTVSEDILTYVDNKESKVTYIASLERIDFDNDVSLFACS